jgi:hydroxyethylthiazole kinase-like uncharacterized protein yjeF
MEGTPLYRSQDVREIDRAAVQADGLAGGELMARAGGAAFASLRRRWPEARRIAVFCGSGNNGGDGYVVARLAREAGWDVTLCATGAPAAPDGDAAQARRAWQAAGGTVQAATREAAANADVVVDALLGIGLSRAPQGAVVAAIEAINAAGRPVLALDLPSGLDADRGVAPGIAVRATATSTFVADKPGLHTGAGRALCGDIELEPLGIAASTRDARPACAGLLRAESLRDLLSPRARDAHKGHHGHVLAIGGELGFGGAIRLCAEAALRAGAGLVSVATRAAHVGPLLAGRPEAMAHAVEDGAALGVLAGRASVLALGPGLGREAWGREMFDAALTLDLPRVLDADALNLLALAPRPLPGDVLTPHPGEAARMLQCETAAVEADRFAAARALVDRFDAVVVLKGAGSIVAAPGRRSMVIGAGNPGLASGGSGDVLTGVIAALRAQGLAAFEAACTGALLHAAAADFAAIDGERGMLASDLFAPLRRLANPR